MPFVGSAVRRQWPVVALASLVLGLGACAPTPPRTTAAPPEVPPRLLSAAPLELPAGCEPGRAAVYRTHFVVEADGRVSEPRSETGDGCVEQALRDWVATFRYEPVTTRTPIAFDWIAVTAKRGG